MASLGPASRCQPELDRTLADDGPAADCRSLSNHICRGGVDGNRL